MIRFLGRRLASTVQLLLLVSIGVFALISLLPGDPARIIAGQEANEEGIALVRAQYHLDEPIPVQYWYWLVNAIRFDFGVSHYARDSVTSMIASTFPITASLIATTAVIAVLIGVPLGVLASVRPGRLLDIGARIVSGFGLAVPNFILGIALLLLLGVHLHWVPVGGYVAFSESPAGWLRHILLPAFTLSLFIAAIVTRQLRAAMIDALEGPAIRAAWARGGRSARVIGVHALKNAGLPALTAFGVQLATLLGGTVIIEQIFSVPGLGPMLLNAITGRDLPVIQAVLLLFVICQVVLSLLVDLAYGLLNPKLRVA